MNVATVKLFLEVLEAGSLSKVAARRQTVQSHISRQISDFEATFGGPLFRRTGRGVAPTELGERAAVRLRSWLLETDRLAQELREESGKLLGEVRLGVIPSAAHPLMTRLFQRLQVEHPASASTSPRLRALNSTRCLIAAPSTWRSSFDSIAQAVTKKNC